MKNGQDRGVRRADVKRVRWSPPEMRRKSARNRLAFVAGISIFGMLGLFQSVRNESTSAHADNPQFRNPPEVSRRPEEKRLRAILKIVNKEFSVLNVGVDQYRQ